MTLERLDHIGLSVADLERSLAFYRDLLGMEVIRVLECAPTSRLGEVAGIPRCQARIAHLKLGDSMLELFEYQDPRGRPLPTDSRQADHGFIHAGFRSNDVRADAARLAKLGVRLISEPVEFRPGVWVVYFFGPDGEVCEIRQTPESI